MKKTIIAVSIVIVLLFIASLSVGIFLADKGSSEAVDGKQASSENQIAKEDKNTVENNTITNTEDDKNNTDTNSGNSEETVDNSENTQKTSDNAVSNTENTQEAGDNTVTNTENTQEVGKNITASTENRQNGESNTVINNNKEPKVTTKIEDVKQNENNSNGNTTNKNVNEIGESTITRIEEKEKLISRGFWDWWTPSAVVVSGTEVADKLTPQTPDFTIEKTATTGIGENKLVYANKNITYTIKVTNNGEQDLKNIEVTDKTPEQTTFVSIDDEQNAGMPILENDVVIGLKWIITVPAKESIEVKFTVKVNENATGTISNAAIVNGKESNEEKTSIITAKKSSKIVERNNIEIKDGLEIAQLGDKIKYTITATNTGDISGKTTIEDTIPLGTELIESSVTDNGKITATADARKQISWDVELEANSIIERTFIVEVKDISGKIENVATVGGESTNPDKKDTAGIKVVKEVIDIKRDKESLGKDGKVQAGDVIEYKIKVTNTGSVDLTNVVLEEKLEGIEISPEDLKIGDLKAGESKEIFATYTVTYEKDIKLKEDRTIINNVEVTGETIPEPGKDPEKVTDEDQTTTHVEEIQDVEVEKATSQTEKVKVGDRVNYTIKVKNTGNVTLNNIPVTDKIKLAAGEETLDIYSDGEYTKKVTEIEKLEVGEEVTLYAKYDVTQADIDAQKTIVNVATANGKNSNEVPVTPEEINQKGTVTIKSIKASTDTVSTPMDVVFVLDTSGSMKDSSKASDMVNAVNSSVKNIMNKNSDSRIGIVAFSGSSNVLLPFGKYGANKDYLNLFENSISETVAPVSGGKRHNSVMISGGTNTQSGIKKGAEMLINVDSTTATVKLSNGKTKTVTRTPLLILVTDGEPTYCYDNETATGKVNGHGYADDTDQYYYYWTLRTAKYYKDQITNKYYQNTDKTAKVFTIGLGLDGNEAVAMLDPTTEKVNECNNSDWQQKELYNLITNNGNTAADAYSYADGSKTGTITGEDLETFLNTSIDSSVENEVSREITAEESRTRRIDLGNIDQNKEFELKIGGNTYNSTIAAQNAGYLKKDSKGYYIDLTKVERVTDVNVTYWER